MKKILIGVAVAAAIAGTGYFAMNKADDVANSMVSQLITDYTNKPVAITYLQSNPLVNEATWQITKHEGDTINSVLHLVLIDDKALDVPLISQIVRGKTEHNGKSYGFGKIITHPEVSKIEGVPSEITNDTLTITKYIGLDGDVAVVNTLAPIKMQEVDFQGLSATVNSSLLDLSAYDANFESKQLTLTNDDEVLRISPAKFTVKMAKDGTYTGTSEAMTVAFSENGVAPIDITLGKGDYSGNYKTIKDLVVPLQNGKALYNTATFSMEGTEVKLNNLEMNAGFYDSGNKLFDARFSLSTDVAAESLQSLGANVTPQHIDLNYALNQLSYKAVNTYYQNVTDWSKAMEEGESIANNEAFQSMLSEVQHSDSQFKLGFDLKAAEGSAEAQGMLGLNDKGKSVDINTLISVANPQQLMQWLAANSTLVVDESIADATGLTVMLQMMLGITPENGKYTINAEIKDGQALVNGQPMM